MGSLTVFWGTRIRSDGKQPKPWWPWCLVPHRCWSLWLCFENRAPGKSSGVYIYIHTYTVVSSFSLSNFLFLGGLIRPIPHLHHFQTHPLASTYHIGDQWWSYIHPHYGSFNKHLLTEAAAPISCKTLARMLARLRAKPTSTNGHQRMLWVICGYFTPLYEILWQNLVGNAVVKPCQWSTIFFDEPGIPRGSLNLCEFRPVLETLLGSLDHAWLSQPSLSIAR